MIKHTTIGLSISKDLAGAASALAHRAEISLSSIYSAAIFKLLTDVGYKHGDSKTFDLAAMRLKAISDIFYNPKLNEYINYVREIPIIEVDKKPI